MRTPAELVASARADLAALDAPYPDHHAKYNAWAVRIRTFFDALIDLAAQMAQPDAEILIDQLVANTADVVAAQEGALGQWLASMHRYTLRNTEDGFLIACRGRSGYQVALDLYRGTTAEPALTSLDIAELDETLAAQAPEHGQVALPPEIPPSHTWWLFRKP